MVADGAADAALGQDPRVHAAPVGMLEAAFAQGASGVAADIVAGHVAPWRFDPAGVGTRRSQLWYGEDDAIVTPAHAAYWDSVLAGTRPCTWSPAAGTCCRSRTGPILVLRDRTGQ